MRALSAAQALKTDTWKVELVKLARKACRCNSYVEVYLFPTRYQAMLPDSPDFGQYITIFHIMCNATTTITSIIVRGTTF